MTPDFILGDTRENEQDANPDVPDANDADAIPGHRVKVYDGLVVDPAGNPDTIGADANGA